MELETRETENGTEITVHADQKVAVSVTSDGEETIYLPHSGSSDSTYYVEDSKGLESGDESFQVFHPDSVDDIEVIN